MTNYYRNLANEINKLGKLVYFFNSLDMNRNQKTSKYL